MTQVNDRRKEKGLNGSEEYGNALSSLTDSCAEVPGRRRAIDRQIAASASVTCVHVVHAQVIIRIQAVPAET